MHTNPDLRLRAYDDFQLCDAAVRVGARAIVIKTHLGNTTARAIMANRYNQIVHGDNDFTMFGSVTLNRCVGGINPRRRGKCPETGCQSRLAAHPSPPAVIWK